MNSTPVPTCRTRPERRPTRWSHWLAAAVAASLIGCGGQPTSPSQPTDLIQTFTAEPASIKAGQAVRLAWEVDGATKVALGGIQAPPDWTGAHVAPLQTTRYQLTATASDGGSVTREVTVEVEAGPTIGRVAVDPTASGLRLPEGFLGLSHDWSQAQLMLGNPDVGVNQVYRQLLTNLIDLNGGPLTLRIGGRDTDQDTAAPSGRIAALAQLHDDLIQASPGVNYILGLNMGSGMPGVAGQQARALVSGLPAGAISAFELGNQPDYFVVNGQRARDYNFREYLAEYRFYAEHIRKAAPGAPPFAGPAMGGFITDPPRSGAAGDFASPDNLARLLTQEFNNLAVVTHHAPAAGTAACAGNARPGYLLRPVAAERGAEALMPYLDAARQAAKPFRAVEMNSLLCTGQPGISDTFESALWVTDALFEYAYRGFQGVDVFSGLWNAEHGWDLRSPFHFEVPARQYQVSGLTLSPPGGTRFPAEYRLRQVLPIYYGMLLFAEATRNQPELLPLDLATEANLKAWATRDSESGHLRIALINKESGESGLVRLSVPGYQAADVRRLLAPSAASQEGISLGGQTLDGSEDGMLKGVRYAERVTAEAGVFEVALSASSAVLLTLSP